MAHSKDIPPSVKTIPDLIEWLADEHHEGTVSGISRKLGASIATANFWRRGVVLPNLDYLERLADHYDLPFDQVMDLWRKSRRKRRGGGGALGLIIALGLLAPTPSVGMEIHDQPVVQVAERMALIRHWLVRSLLAWAHALLSLPCPA
jgi:hypothetical protein